MNHTQMWINPNTSGEIQKIFYAYSLDLTPPCYVLYVSLRGGTHKKYTECKREYFMEEADLQGLDFTQNWIKEIPVQVQKPVEPKERGPSCSIC